MKRCFDILFASILLALVLPLILLLLIAIPIESRGWPIFSQMRVGRYGKPLRVYKLRSMTQGEMPPNFSPLELIAYDKNRITRIGYWIRKSGLDESPQFLQVIIGQMSLVGPRPLPPTHIVPDMYSPVRDGLRPGLTSLAVVFIMEVNQNYRTQRARLDNFYALKRSFCLDLWIIASTFRALRRTNF